MLSRFQWGLRPCAVFPSQMLEVISIYALFCCTWMHVLESQDEGLHCCTCIPHKEERINNTQIQSSVHYSNFFLRNNLFYSNPGLTPLAINHNSAAPQTKRCNFSKFSLFPNCILTTISLLIFFLLKVPHKWSSTWSNFQTSWVPSLNQKSAFK